jgi:methionyl-tRNA formyltransferase
VQHAILHGDDITGATTFRLVPELDAGPVFGVVTELIRPTDTAGDLLGRLAVSGAELLVATLDGIESGQLEARPQPAEGVTLAPKITAEDARVRWDRPAAAVDRQIRACTPSPGAWTVLGDTRLKLWPLAAVQPPVVPDGPSGRSASAAPGSAGDSLAPGELRVLRSAVLVGTGTTPVQLGDVQPPGKRRMSAVEWARGLHLAERGRGTDQDAAVLA